MEVLETINQYMPHRGSCSIVEEDFSAEQFLDIMICHYRKIAIKKTWIRASIQRWSQGMFPNLPAMLKLDWGRMLSHQIGIQVPN